MYYVVKLYDYAKPLIVEAFKSLECAKQYRDALIKDGKGKYIVVSEVD